MEQDVFSKYRNPVEYLKVFFRRKWLFIAPVFFGLVLGILACFILPPTYESATVILIEEEKIINPLIQGLAVSTPAVQRMQVLREQLLGWNSLVELTKKLDLAKNVRTQMAFENLIRDLRKNIFIQMRDDSIVRITYRDQNPDKAQLVAKTLTDVLVEQNMRSQAKETNVAVDFIKEQLQVYKRKIKEAEVADLEDQLKKLLVDSTEAHPLVKELRQKIDIAKKELDSEEYKVADYDMAQYDQPMTTKTQQQLKEELDKLLQEGTPTVSGSMAYAFNDKDSNDPNSVLYKLILMDKLDSALARDMRVNENIYNMLLQKLETAKITQRLEASKQGTRYTILDPPRMPLRPSGPNKFKVIFLGLFMGIFSGTGLVFGREFMDHSFLDIEDAKAALEFPVLGAISRVVTQEEIDKEKYKHRKFMTISVVSSVSLIIIALLYYIFRK